MEQTNTTSSHKTMAIILALIAGLLIGYMLHGSMNAGDQGAASLKSGGTKGPQVYCLPGYIYSILDGQCHPGTVGTNGGEMTVGTATDPGVATRLIGIQCTYTNGSGSGTGTLQNGVCVPDATNRTTADTSSALVPMTSVQSDAMKASFTSLNNTIKTYFPKNRVPPVIGGGSIGAKDYKIDCYGFGNNGQGYSYTYISNTNNSGYSVDGHEYCYATAIN